MIMGIRFLAVFAVCFLGFFGQAQAELSIGVVDMRALVRDAKAAKDITKQLSASRDTALKELSGKEKKLIEEEKELVEDKKTLQEEDFIKRAKAFEKKRLELQKLSVKYRQELNVTALEAEKGLTTKIIEIVQKIAADDKYDLIITKQNVIVGATSIDLTERVQKTLDKEVPTYKVSTPK